MCSFLATNVPDVDLERANYLQQLRGPDHTKVVKCDGVTFVHNLLSINGAFAPQPFIGDGLACVYNGEIYNSSDFGGFESDGMCLLPAYKALGPRFVRELDGEFAIVILDRPNGSLFISADVFGTKPIHYSFSGEHFGVASYPSALEAIGFSSITRLEPNHYVTISLTENRLMATGTIFDFALRQYKTHFDDWSDAFSLAIRKRTKHCREKIFIGLSSGYDSGAISSELDKQGIEYKSYSIMSNEKIDIIEDRVLRRRMGSEFEFIFPSEEQKLRVRQGLEKTVERVTRDIVSNGSGYAERWSLHHDGAAAGLAIICEKAKKEGRRVYLSGQGADEILSDYGFLGTPIYAHSNFGGRYPEDLNSIFPWPSFFGSTQAAYLAKEEYVAGSFGIEARYPFLDKNVVQEFLSLANKLKNGKYKSVVRNLFEQSGYPCALDEKFGFVP
jgi:asparagine synthetase B (glutamine-hydrolysing)